LRSISNLNSAGCCIKLFGNVRTVRVNKDMDICLIIELCT